ncbi:LPXTG cell wall anchor domain-containing protein [bacterium]|nr:LPXTG cell wall anchor domain-containing protein [bacterium]
MNCRRLPKYLFAIFAFLLVSSASVFAADSIVLKDSDGNAASANVNMCTEESLNYTASIGTEDVYWGSISITNSDPSVVKVATLENKEGDNIVSYTVTVTPLAAGSATITIGGEDTNHVAFTPASSVSFTVEELTLSLKNTSGGNVASSSHTMYYGDTLTLNAGLLNGNVPSTNFTDIVWSTSGTEVLTLSSNSGNNVTLTAGTMGGTVRVTASSADCSAVNAYIDVVVAPPQIFFEYNNGFTGVTSDSLNSGSAIIVDLENDEDVTLTARYTPSDSNGFGGISWTTSDPQFVSISSTSGGTIHVYGNALTGNNSVTVTANTTYNGYPVSASIYVNVAESANTKYQSLYLKSSVDTIYSNGTAVDVMLDTGKTNGRYNAFEGLTFYVSYPSTDVAYVKSTLSSINSNYCTGSGNDAIEDYGNGSLVVMCFVGGLSSSTSSIKVSGPIRIATIVFKSLKASGTATLSPVPEAGYVSNYSGKLFTLTSGTSSNSLRPSGDGGSSYDGDYDNGTSDGSGKNISKDDLPSTGRASSTLALIAGASALFIGLFLYVFPMRKYVQIVNHYKGDSLKK